MLFRSTLAGADRRTSGDWMDARCISIFSTGWNLLGRFRCCPIPLNQIWELSVGVTGTNSRIRSRTADGLISGNGRRRHLRVLQRVLGCLRCFGEREFCFIDLWPPRHRPIMLRFNLLPVGR